MFKRLDTNSGDYRREVINNAKVREKLMQINAAMDACEADCAALREFYSGYSYLWTVDLDTAFEEFKVSFVFFFPFEISCWPNGRLVLPVGRCCCVGFVRWRDVRRIERLELGAAHRR